jgi:hypothetical protein
MPIVLRSRSLNLLETLGPVQASNGIAFTLWKVADHGFGGRWKGNNKIDTRIIEIRYEILN